MPFAVLAIIPPLFAIAENHLMSDPDEFKAALTQKLREVRDNDLGL